MQETDLLCNKGANDGSQASGCAGQTTEPYLPEHPVALIASQTEEISDQAMDQPMELELSEASYTAAIITSASNQEPELEATQSLSSSRSVASANNPKGEINAHAPEDNAQSVARKFGIGGVFSAIEGQSTVDNESTADHQDDQADGYVGSPNLSERDASTTPTSPIPHTASHLEHTINKSVAHSITGKTFAFW